MLAAQYVAGALLLVLTWHDRPPASPWSVAAPGWSPGSEGDGGNGNGDGGAPGKADDPLAQALAALGQACDQARSRPAVLRELRRLQHGLAQVRGAVIQCERKAVRQSRGQPGEVVWSGRLPDQPRAASG